MFRKLTTREEVAAAYDAGLLAVNFAARLNSTGPEYIKKTAASVDGQEYANSWARFQSEYGYWDCYILVEDDADDEEG